MGVASGPEKFSWEVGNYVRVTLEKAPFSGLKLTSAYILGDDLQKIEAILEKKRVELRP